jgi:uncharacterized protein
VPSSADDYVDVRPSAIHGFGVFARGPIAKDTRIGDYEGARVDENDTYVLWVEYDDGEVAGIDGANALRYINHAHAPNAAFWGHELYALRDIEAGEEITFDYGEDWVEQP